MFCQNLAERKQMAVVDQFELSLVLWTNWLQAHFKIVRTLIIIGDVNNTAK